jgi:hypothetical protein
MASRQRRPSKRPARRERPAAEVLPNLRALVPREWRHSPAWKHFRSAQVEFLSGVQILLKEALDRVKSRREQERTLQRIEVEK